MRPIAPLLALLALAACRTGPALPAPRDSAGVLQGVWTYACAGGRSFTAEMVAEGDSVRVGLDGRTHTLPHAISADGARYAAPGDALVVWFKGMEDAFVMEGDSITIANCRRQR